MPRRVSLIASLAVAASISVALVGCGDDKPKGVVAAPVTSVEQMNNEISGRLEQQKEAAEKVALVESEKADRLRFVEVLETPLNQWRSLYGQLAGKKTTEVVEMSAKMRAIRADMGSTPTTQCTVAARETIFRGMDEVHSVIDAFKDINGPVPEELAKRLGNAEAAVRMGAGELAACRA
jgi:hypothetical protein